MGEPGKGRSVKKKKDKKLTEEQEGVEEGAEKEDEGNDKNCSGSKYSKK